MPRWSNPTGRTNPTLLALLNERSLEATALRAGQHPERSRVRRRGSSDRGGLQRHGATTGSEGRHQAALLPFCSRSLAPPVPIRGSGDTRLLETADTDLDGRSKRRGDESGSVRRRKWKDRKGNSEEEPRSRRGSLQVVQRTSTDRRWSISIGCLRHGRSVCPGSRSHVDPTAGHRQVWMGVHKDVPLCLCLSVLLPFVYVCVSVH